MMPRDSNGILVRSCQDRQPLAILCIGANSTCAGPENSSQVTEGSIISVQYDGYNLDYVFFQSDDGVQRGTIIPNQSSTDWTGFTALSDAPNSSTVYSWLVPGQKRAFLIVPAQQIAYM